MWHRYSEKKKAFDCEDCTEALKIQRNCRNHDKNTRFKLQYDNREIIKECPNSYFEGLTQAFFSSYDTLKLLKSMGINSSSNDLALLELEAYAIIENEIEKLKDYTHKKELRNAKQ